MWQRGILLLNFASISRTCAERICLMNILLSSVGRRAYLVDYFRSAVGPGGKVIATNSVADTTGMMAADVACVVPEAGGVGFIDALLAVCRQHEVDLLFSLHDWEAPFIAEASKRFKEAGVVLGVSSPEVLQTCLDKYRTFEFCRDRGISTPRTFLSENEALKACEDGVVGFPLIVKARFGQGSLALHKVHNAKELEAACLLASAEIARFEDNQLHASATTPIIIQECIVGDEYGLDIVNDFEGRFRACLAKRKLGMRSGETDAAVSVHDEALERFGEAIGTSLEHTGMLDADVIVRDGTPYLLELNPRFGGHYPFSHAAGANVPAALVSLAQGKEPDSSWLRTQSGVLSIKDITLRRSVGSSHTTSIAAGVANQVVRAVLVCPGGTEIGLEICRALKPCKEVKVISAGFAGSPAESHYASHSSVGGVRDEGWLPELQDVVRREGVTHIFPAHDELILPLLANEKALGAKIVTSGTETCRVARSKRGTVQHFTGVVPVPRVYEDVSSVDAYPVFVKPDEGQGSRGAAVAHDADELALLLRQDGTLLIEEFLPGEEFTVDCFSDRDRGVLYAAGRSRLRITNGIASHSRVVDDARFADYARRIHAALPFQGAWFFQVKADAAGEWKLLEVAPRIAGTSGLSRASGVNLPLLSLYESDRVPVSIPPAVPDVVVHRTLESAYRHGAEYEALYLDYDDTLVVNGAVNTRLVKIAYQHINAGKPVLLVTRHNGDLAASLRKHRLEGLFDEVVHLKQGESKRNAIKHAKVAFIDDSHRELEDLRRHPGVVALHVSAAELLIDYRGL